MDVRLKTDWLDTAHRDLTVAGHFLIVEARRPELPRYPIPKDVAVLEIRIARTVVYHAPGHRSGFGMIESNIGRQDWRWPRLLVFDIPGPSLIAQP